MLAGEENKEEEEGEEEREGEEGREEREEEGEEGEEGEKEVGGEESVSECSGAGQPVEGCCHLLKKRRKRGCRQMQ